MISNDIQTKSRIITIHKTSYLRRLGIAHVQNALCSWQQAREGDSKIPKYPHSTSRVTVIFDVIKMIA